MTAIIAIFISVVAAAISFCSLWISRLKPFNLLVSAGEIRLRVYPVKNGDKKWYILTFATPLFLANLGAKADQIISFRIVARFKEVKDSYDILNLYGEVDRRLYEENVKQIFLWQDVATVRGDEPFILLPRQTVSKYMVFKTYVNFPIASQKVTYTLEVYTGKNHYWEQLETWAMPLLPIHWSELVENGTSIGVKPDSVPPRKVWIDGNNLYNKLKIKGKVPKGGFQAAPTYQDYPAKDNS